MSVELGDKVKDTVTGMTGIAVARHTYLQGCDRISIQPPFDKKANKLPEAIAFDEPQVAVLVPKQKPRKSSPRPGGPSKFEDTGKATVLR